MSTNMNLIFNLEILSPIQFHYWDINAIVLNDTHVPLVSGHV